MNVYTVKADPGRRWKTERSLGNSGKIAFLGIPGKFAKCPEKITISKVFRIVCDDYGQTS